MTTQTLRGLANSGPMHWRGDRADGFFGSGLGEVLSFNNFIVAFEGLVGREALISTADMQKFTDFALTMTLPPNPVRALNNSLTVDQAAGLSFFAGSRRSDGIPIVANLGFTCEGCHNLNASQGFFGTNGDASFENEAQIVKIAHLRNLYQKVGMFGMPNVDFINGFDNGHQGDQVRGFGFLHDGSVDTVFRFLNATVFNNNNGVGFDGPSGGNVKRRQVEQLMLAFDTDVAPVVGQQVTLSGTNGLAVTPRIDLLVQRAQTNFPSQVLGGVVKECNLIVKGTIAGAARGWVMSSTSAVFTSDRAIEPTIPDAALRLLAAVPGQELTYTCVPPGSGQRLGIDRDLDTVRDGDDNCPATVNPGQEDANMNGIGDACDTGGATTTTSTSSSSSSTLGTSTSTSTSSSSSSTLGTSTTSVTSTSSSSSSSATSTSVSTTTSTTATTLPGVGVSAKKLIVVDRMALASQAKVVYVSKDRGLGSIDKGPGTDLGAIEAGFSIGYVNGATSGAFVLPSGASDGTSGWVVNQASVARYVNRQAPGGPTGAQAAVIKPGRLLKFVGKSTGDTPIDVLGAGHPGGSGITTVYTVANGGFVQRHCTSFTACDHKPIAAGTGAKLVCKPGVPTVCP
jgi:hypothetical protein